MAWLAGVGGVLNIGFSVGMPIFRRMHHQSADPGFFFFALWGLVALMGCAACIHTYLGSAPPDRPPRGGLPERGFTLVEGGAAQRMPLDPPRAA